jgi:hypothetical protein
MSLDRCSVRGQLHGHLPYEDLSASLPSLHCLHRLQQILPCPVTSWQQELAAAGSWHRLHLPLLQKPCHLATLR